MFFTTVIFYFWIALCHQSIPLHRCVCNKFITVNYTVHQCYNHYKKNYVLPVKVELVKIRTIFELTGGRDFNDPAKIESIVFSSIFYI